jgi:hypothetical protein
VCLGCPSKKEHEHAAQPNQRLDPVHHDVKLAGLHVVLASFVKNETSSTRNAIAEVIVEGLWAETCEGLYPAGAPPHLAKLDASILDELAGKPLAYVACDFAMQTDGNALEITEDGSWKSPYSAGLTCTCKPLEEWPVRHQHADRDRVSPQDMLEGIRTSMHVTPSENYREGIRSLARDFCAPCTNWVGHLTPLEDLYPMKFLDTAVSAGCLSFVLADGRREYGPAYPVECRP